MMEEGVLLECAFFIPQRRDNNLSDGELHSAQTWQWLDTQLYLSFKGGTIAPGWYEGFYEDPDTQQRVNDHSRKFIVAITEDNVDSLRTMLKQACGKFCQKMIYLSVAGRVEFVKADDYEPNGSIP